MSAGRHILLDLLDHFGIASDGVAEVTISASGPRGGVIEVDVRYEWIKAKDGMEFEVRSYEVKEIDLTPEAECGVDYTGCITGKGPCAAGEVEAAVSGCAMRDCIPESLWGDAGRDVALHNGSVE